MIDHFTITKINNQNTKWLKYKIIFVLQVHSTTVDEDVAVVHAACNSCCITIRDFRLNVTQNCMGEIDNSMFVQ